MKEKRNTNTHRTVHIVQLFCFVLFLSFVPLKWNGSRLFWGLLVVEFAAIWISISFWNHFISITWFCKQIPHIKPTHIIEHKFRKPNEQHFTCIQICRLKISISSNNKKKLLKIATKRFFIYTHILCTFCYCCCCCCGFGCNTRLRLNCGHFTKTHLIMSTFFVRLMLSVSIYRTLCVSVFALCAGTTNANIVYGFFLLLPSVYSSPSHTYSMPNALIHAHTHRILVIFLCIHARASMHTYTHE